MNPTYDVSFEKTRDNLTTVKVNGYYLHSKFNAIKEAKEIANTMYKPHHLHVIFGYGMGYIIDELIQLRKFNEPILIIDPLVDNKLLELGIDESENVHYLPFDSLEVIRNEVSGLGAMTNKMIYNISPNYKKIFLEEVREIAKIISDAQRKEITNIATTEFFSMEWQINYAMNLKKIMTDYSLNKLYKKYDCPIVVAASGPSLIKQLPYLKAYREHVILICAGSTINSLLKQDIRPDYVVSIDGGIVNYNHFKDLDLEGIELMYSSTLHFKVRQQFLSDSFLFVPHVHPEVGEILNKRAKKDFPVITGGGSVAHFALSIAKYITTGTICLIGQDLAYTNNQTHSEGNKNNTSIENKNTILIDGYYGDQVVSDKIFQGMLHTFEDINTLQPHSVPVYNCTEGGAKINGFIQVPFKEFLQKYATKPVRKINFVSNQEEHDVDFLKEDFIIYDQILSLLKKGLKIIHKEKGPLFTKNVIDKIGEIERELNKLYKKTCVEMLLEPLIRFAEHEFLPAVDESKYDEFKRVKKYIIFLYGKSVSMMETYIERLNEILKEESEEQ